MTAGPATPPVCQAGPVSQTPVTTAPQAEPTEGRTFPTKAKGARPVFFDDGGATDAVVDIVTALAAEVWALRERVANLEAVLAASGHLEPGLLDRWVPEPAEQDRRVADAAAFAGRVYRVFEEMREQVAAGETPDGYAAVVQRAYDEI